MRNYSYLGYIPHNELDKLTIDVWSKSDLYDQDCKPTEEAIENGCTFEIEDNETAFLISPLGYNWRMRFVRVEQDEPDKPETAEHITYKHYLLINNYKDSMGAFRAYLLKYEPTFKAMPPAMKEQCINDWYNRRFIVSPWM